MDSSEYLPDLPIVALNHSSLPTTIFISLRSVLRFVALHRSSLPSTIFVYLRSFPLPSTISFCISRSRLHSLSLSLHCLSLLTNLLKQKIDSNFVLALNGVAVIIYPRRRRSEFENFEISNDVYAPCNKLLGPVSLRSEYSIYNLISVRASNPVYSINREDPPKLYIYPVWFFYLCSWKIRIRLVKST